MESEIVKAITQNAAGLSGAAVAVIGALSLVIGLVKGKIFLEPQLTPILTVCKENAEALKVANVELARVNILLAKAETEREYVWKSRAIAASTAPEVSPQ